MSKLPPLPVDLNELPDQEREEIKPGPIGFIPRKHRPSIDAEMAKVVRDINEAAGLPRATPFVLPQPIERVTDELSSLLTASAEAMLVEAQNLAAETKAWSDNLRQEIAKKIEEHATLTERIQAFGKEVLAAHNKYHGDQ